jgi:serine/threonine protein kinase
LAYLQCSDGGKLVMAEMSTVADLLGYVLQTHRLGSEYILYRGRHAAGDAAPILVLAPAAAQQSPATLERLEHEYALASELDPDWAVQPSALAHRDGRRVLVFKDPGGEPLDRLLGEPLQMSEFLRIAIVLADALCRVHERGLVHKDIKPAHIVFDRSSGGLWLTGFGIASRLPRERQDPKPPGKISGTLAYMAPEQISKRSDASCVPNGNGSMRPSDSHCARLRRRSASKPAAVW